MSAPQCTLCGGKGTRRVMSFSVVGANRETTCNACKGRGVMTVMVDVYEIVSHLENMGSTKEAVSVERCFGLPSGPNQEGKSK